MQERKKVAEQLQAIVLLDSNNRVVAVNDEWRKITEGRISPGSGVDDINACVPGISEWIKANGEAKEGTNEFDNGDYRFSVQILKLPEAGLEVDRLLLIRAKPAGEDPAAQLRHDLKNRIGGLKLYATFLKQKLKDQAELLEVVEKMIKSLDQMTQEANKIRF